MLALGIDTATRQVTVTVGSRDGVLGAITVASPPGAPPRHTEALAPAIDRLLRTIGIDVDALDVVGVGIGPGMFTGLRVGVVTGAALAVAIGVPVVPVVSLDLLAHPLRAVAGDAFVVPVIDARRAEVYGARYRRAGADADGLVRVSGYEIARPDDFAEELAALGEPVVLCGDGAHRVELPARVRAVRAGAAFDRPNPTALLELTCDGADRGQVVRPQQLEPMYLRKSDAEVNADVRSERRPVAS
jgi:tRNA threonylcarbamoyladenosine biosynthesis protein TsaB